MIPSHEINAVRQHHQCACGQFCDEAGEILTAQPSLTEKFQWMKEGTIDVITCQKCKINPPASEPAPSPRTIAPPKAPVHETTCRPQSTRRGRTGPLQHNDGGRGCPEEREFTYAKPVHEMAAHDYHEAFINSTTCAEGDKRVLRYLMRGFDGTNPGPWRTGIDIQEQCDIEAISACTSRLRAQLKARGWYCDSHVIKGEALNHWAYRICRLEDSEAIKRERQRKEDKRQQQLETGARN